MYIYIFYICIYPRRLNERRNRHKSQQNIKQSEANEFYPTELVLATKKKGSIPVVRTIPRRLNERTKCAPSTNKSNEIEKDTNSCPKATSKNKAAASGHWLGTKNEQQKTASRGGSRKSKKRKKKSSKVKRKPKKRKKKTKKKKKRTKKTK